MNNLLLPRGYRSAASFNKKLHEADESSSIRRGRRRALTLFHTMSQRVPAYKDFLEMNKVNPLEVKNATDLSRVPTIDKDNYLRKYPRAMLCWDGSFGSGNWVISTTSGSTGEPYYFPRQASQDWQYALTAEMYLRNNFEIHKKSTLYIVAFPMGAWIGGLFTYEALKIVAEEGKYDLSIITPGIHKQEVINAVKQLGSSFDQVIIGAYAPFLKDILDDGTRQGVNWPSYNVGFVFSAEAFTEKFRDYVFKVAKPKNKLLSTLNHYGTVDLGTMAHETPESILIRRKLVESHSLNTLFPEKVRQPTFCQYDPGLFYFEAENDSLLCTAFSGIPLVRYDLKDYGGLISRKDVHKKLSAAGINIDKHIKEEDIADTTWNIPFLYIYERKDFSVSYYAFQLYPDMVRRPLQDDKFEKEITGKFTMIVDYDDSGRQKLNIHIEKKHGIKHQEQVEKALQEHIHKSLIEESSEYRETSQVIGEVIKPVIKLWEYEDNEHFRSGGKQKWVKK